MTPEEQTADVSVPPAPEERQLKFTIATVTYNAADLIERTIRSVEEQTYPYVEHLIVDGNSRDTTLEHVHHYQERNSRASIRREIVCISEPDEGLYDAMNKAIGMATGKYILFLNAGDTLHSSDTLERVAQAALTGISSPQNFEKLPAVLYGDTNLVDEAGTFLRPRRLSPPEHLTWRSFKDGMLVCHQAFFARTDFARHHLYNRRYRFSADFDWCIRIMRDAESKHLPLVHTHITVADYLSEGMTTRHHRASLFERFRIMCRHYGLFSTIARHAWFVVRSVTKN